MRGGARTHQRPHLPPPARPVASGALSCAGVGLARGPSRIAPVKGRHPCSTPHSRARLRKHLLAARRAPDGSGRRPRHSRHRRRGRDQQPGRRRRRLARPSARRRQPPDDDHVRRPAFPDYGLTADVVLALDAAKVGRRAARQATGALRHNVLAYTGGGDSTEHYAGAYAKLVLVAAAQGADATAFGGGPRKNLVAGLRALECTKGRSCCRRGQGPVLGRLPVRRLQQRVLAVAGPDRAGAGDQPWRLARRGVVPGRSAVPQRWLPGDLRRHRPAGPRSTPPASPCRR